MNIEIPGPGAQGFFKLHKYQISSTGNKVEEQLMEFPNLITDAGLAGQMTIPLGDWVAASSGRLLSYAMVGNGTAAESTSSTSLASYLAGTNAILSTGSHSSSTSPPYFDSFTVVKRFSPGFLSSSSNVNITEVGMGTGNNSGILFTRSLIKDSGGTPVSMTITPIDYLDIYYTLRLYKYSGPDITGQVSIAGVQTDFILRSASITDDSLVGSWDAGGVVAMTGGDQYSRVYGSTSSLGSITGTPSGVSASSSSVVNHPYVSGYTRNITYSYSVSQGNVSGGIKCAMFRTTRGHFQVSFNPVIPKDNTKTLAFTITVGPISRYTP